MSSTSFPPESDLLLPLAKLGQRWACHPTSALKRAVALGIPIVKFNRRAYSVRLSDIIRAEEEASR